MFSIRLPKTFQDQKILNFFKRKKLGDLIKASKEKKIFVNNMERLKPWSPKIGQLYLIYQIILLNKRLTILEFGSGWSSLIFACALDELKRKYFKEVKYLRKNDPFKLFSIDNESKYLKISKTRVNKFKKKNKIISEYSFNFSEVNMTNFNGFIATEYKKIPACNPDLIFIDGPGQFKVKGTANGISTKHKDIMPMSCDVLKIEFFLLPGTIILADGRGANCEFLRLNLKRKWVYKYFRKFDMHIFCLVDKTIGKYSENLIRFYRSKSK